MYRGAAVEGVSKFDSCGIGMTCWSAALYLAFIPTPTVGFSIQLETLNKPSLSVVTLEHTSILLQTPSDRWVNDRPPIGPQLIIYCQLDQIRRPHLALRG